VIRRVALLGAIAAAVAASGCGSDSSGDESQPAPSIPTVTAPQLSTTAPATTTAPGTTSTGKGKYNPQLPDSETNDVPPPAGSPQEAFEKQCQQNPQACG
jgi:multidrug efflux pump subunit AcrA (membrane-fusion protein)